MVYPARYTFVHPLLRFRRQRILNRDGEVVGQQGKVVSPVQVVVRSPKTADYQMINAYEQLNVSPDDVADLLLIEPNSPVEQGMLLARRKQFIGAKEIHSPIDGLFRGLKNGYLIVQQAGQWEELRAGINGRIIKHINNQGVELEINGALLQANWSNGKESNGLLRFAISAPDAPFTVAQIDGDIMGHILVVGKVNQPDALESIANIGLRGLVAASLSVELLPLVRQLNFPVFLTEGIGKQAMAMPFFNLLQELNEQEATLLGSKKGRPEIIVTRQTPAAVEEKEAFRPLSVGQFVRVLQMSHASQIGQVSRLYRQTAVSPSGVQARGADVTLMNGKTIFVPYNNLDLILQD